MRVVEAMNTENTGGFRDRLKASLAELQEINDSTMRSERPTNGMCVQRWIDGVTIMIGDADA